MKALAWLATGLYLLGCGSSHDRSSDAGGGTRDGATARDGGPGDAGARDAGSRDAGLPSECRADSVATPPYPTVYRLTNDTDADLWLLEECRVQLTVSACASGYGPVSLYGDCTIDCADAEGGCVACGPCMRSAQLVAPGAFVDVSWSGNTYTFDTNASGCSCHHVLPAPAARYRISVPVYGSAEAASSGAVLRTVDVDFVLPAPGGTVVVPLGGG